MSGSTSGVRRTDGSGTMSSGHKKRQRNSPALRNARGKSKRQRTTYHAYEMQEATEGLPAGRTYVVTEMPRTDADGLEEIRELIMDPAKRNHARYIRVLKSAFASTTNREPPWQVTEQLVRMGFSPYMGTPLARRFWMDCNIFVKEDGTPKTGERLSADFQEIHSIDEPLTYDTQLHMKCLTTTPNELLDQLDFGLRAAVFFRYGKHLPREYKCKTIKETQRLIETALHGKTEPERLKAKIKFTHFPVKYWMYKPINTWRPGGVMIRDVTLSVDASGEVIARQPEQTMNGMSLRERREILTSCANSQALKDLAQDNKFDPLEWLKRTTSVDEILAYFQNLKNRDFPEDATCKFWQIVTHKCDSKENTPGIGHLTPEQCDPKGPLKKIWNVAGYSEIPELYEYEAPIAHHSTGFDPAYIKAL